MSSMQDVADSFLDASFRHKVAVFDKHRAFGKLSGGPWSLIKCYFAFGLKTLVCVSKVELHGHDPVARRECIAVDEAP